VSTSALLDKIVARGTALRGRVETLPRPLVFTNGVFDVLHRGHVTYLDAARRLGAALLVAVNKGPDRPLNRDIDRAVVLAALAAVDLVTFFEEDTPLALLAEMRPDLYVKGGDYRMETLAESRLVRSWGGDAVAMPFVDGFSTTALVARVKGG
jgi:rfaE bifunctional protein nucleotidyltransferase chain/domain